MPRPLFVAAFLLWCATACALAQSQPPPGDSADAQRRSPDQANPQPPINITVTAPEPSPERAARDEQRQERNVAAQEDVRDFTRALTVLAFVQAGITFVALLLSYRATKAATVSADASERSATAATKALLLTHRPKLVVRNVVIPIPGVNANLTLEGGTLWVSNVGDTTANVLKVHAQWVIANDLPMENPANAAEVPDGPIQRLDPGEVLKVTLPTLKVKDLNEYRAFKYGNVASAWIVGWIKYRDDANNFRRTAFCRRFHKEAERYVVQENPDYEYAD